MNKILILLTILFCCVACGPKQFKPAELPKIEFNATSEYHLDLDKIQKPEKIVPQFAKLSGNNLVFVSDSKEATHVVLVPQEYAKISEIINLAITYKSITKEQEVLINMYISQVNSLKELIAVQQETTKQYRELWIAAENSYRYEQYIHNQDNMYNKFFNIITLGGIALVAFAL